MSAGGRKTKIQWRCPIQAWCQALWKYSPRRHPISSRARPVARPNMFNPNGGKILIHEGPKISAKATAIGAAAVIMAAGGAIALAGSALAAATHKPGPVVSSHTSPTTTLALATPTPTKTRRVASTKASLTTTPADAATSVTFPAPSPPSRATVQTVTPTATTTTGKDPYTAVAGSNSLHKTFTGTSTDLATAERKALKACERHRTRPTRDRSSRRSELWSKQSDCRGYAWISVNLGTNTVAQGGWK